MAAVLTQLGGVAPADVTLLTDDPTRQDVIEALAEVERRAAAERAQNRETVLVFFYSGHSTPQALELTGTTLKLKQLRQYLKRSVTHVRLAVLEFVESDSAERPAAHLHHAGPRGSPGEPQRVGGGPGGLRADSDGGYSRSQESPGA